MRPLYTGVADVLDTIEDCLAQRRFLPALVLLYSAIDAMASIECEGATRATFVPWVAKYMLKAQSLRCTALELYGARCGILHRFSAESDFSKSAKARMVAYAFENARDPEAAAQALAPKGCVVIPVRDLVNAFRAGLADYLEEVESDPVREKRLSATVSMWFDKVLT